MEKRFEGVYVAAVTPFTEDGAIDKEAMMENIEFMIKEGAAGIFAGGTYAEGPLLGRDYEEYFRVLAEAVKGRIPIIAQIGAPDTRTVMELAATAAACKMDAIAAVPPFYYSHDDGAIQSYFREVVASAELPLFIYNNPARTGNDISLALFERLAGLKGIVGIKDSSNSLTQFCKYSMVAPDDFCLLIGSDDLVLGGLVMGAKGAVVVVGNVAPKLLVDVYKAFRAGDYEEARKLQYRAYEYRAALKGPYIATYKEAMNLVGLKGGYTRKPLRGLVEEEKAKLRARLEAIGAL